MKKNMNSHSQYFCACIHITWTDICWIKVRQCRAAFLLPSCLRFNSWETQSDMQIFKWVCAPLHRSGRNRIMWREGMNSPQRSQPSTGNTSSGKAHPSCPLLRQVGQDFIVDIVQSWKWDASEGAGKNLAFRHLHLRAISRK